jgi:hypothetical protein
MVEIEIGVLLRGRCLDRRIDDPERLRREIAAWGNAREMLPTPRSNGCSQQKRPAPKWDVPIRTLPKSHNLCAKPPHQRVVDDWIEGPHFV